MTLYTRSLQNNTLYQVRVEATAIHLLDGEFQIVLPTKLNHASAIAIDVCEQHIQPLGLEKILHVLPAGCARQALEHCAVVRVPARVVGTGRTIAATTSLASKLNPKETGVE
eukprot:TRINITY_DN11165_c0_g1_i4.p1 TRINITY_DN11165_c0_g1~~TRINITY_DN11165_c0_g1_i4.p1  ORF type:complete len:112 (-),score=11.25 TRINITY_DN11165_c0_g1_i4:553-888(-)